MYFEKSVRWRKFAVVKVLLLIYNEKKILSYREQSAR